MSFFGLSRFGIHLVVTLVTLLALRGVRSFSYRRQAPGACRSPLLLMMWLLRTRIGHLADTVEPEEADAGRAMCLYDGTRSEDESGRLSGRLVFRIFWLTQEKEKGGLCFQFATELLRRLDALKLETLELHWAESFERTASEHNVIVVTAKGQPFQEGILSG